MNEEFQQKDNDKEEIVKKKVKKIKPNAFFVFALILSLVMGFAGGLGSIVLLSGNTKLQDFFGLNNLSVPITKTEKIKLEESSAIMDTVKKVSPSVVSISTTKNVVDFFGQTYEQKGGGTGFIITSDGLIATNKHVVSEEGATYTVFTSDGKDYEAKVMAKDPYNDLAVLKIEANGLPTVELGESNQLGIGQWVVAIGNALGEFENTVTVGVISGTDRKITATGGGQTETLEGLLQTDAAINSGNSGGPLVNLAGQVVGINTAVAGQAQNIGFAIPIDSVKKAIDSIKKTGEIKRPMLGVRYVPVTKEIAKVNDLSVDYGVWVISNGNRNYAAVIPGSPADKAGIVENDIILEVNGQRIDDNNSLSRVIAQYNIGDEVELKVLHKGDEKKVKAKLTEMKE